MGIARSEVFFFGGRVSFLFVLGGLVFGSWPLSLYPTVGGQEKARLAKLREEEQQSQQQQELEAQKVLEARRQRHATRAFR